eukprot:354482-Chlamydomonas_euryale.AAC.2
MGLRESCIAVAARPDSMCAACVAQSSPPFMCGMSGRLLPPIPCAACAAPSPPPPPCSACLAPTCIAPTSPLPPSPPTLLAFRAACAVPLTCQLRYSAQNVAPPSNSHTPTRNCTT